MKELLKLIQQFEERNNISTTILFHSDASGQIVEFFDEEELTMFSSIDELYTFLKKTSYQLDENGRCYSRVRIKED